jgi:cell division protein FtsI (penicillin-binding protein 3)
MVTALKATVSTNGTAMKAKLEFHTAAGKTGTAQKIVDGKYVRNKHYASFIGFFPADNPELCISVVLDEPRKGTYGGETAAPVFKRIAERAAQYLAIPPDPIPEQTLAANASMKGAK